MQSEKISLYAIKSELGRGGMATVYRGYAPRWSPDGSYLLFAFQDEELADAAQSFL